MNSSVSLNVEEKESEVDLCSPLEWMLMRESKRKVGTLAFLLCEEERWDP